MYNRTRSKADQLVEEVAERSAQAGGITTIKVVESVEEVVNSSDIVITSLSSDAVVTEIYDRIAEAIRVSPLCFPLSLRVGLIYNRCVSIERFQSQILQRQTHT